MSDEWTAEAARAAIEQAEAKLDALCQGTERFTMRIPADPKYDHDLVISRGLQAGKNALNALTAANQRAGELEKALARAEDVIRFYGKEENYEFVWDMKANGTCPVEDDQGQRARDWLYGSGKDEAATPATGGARAE